VQNIQLAPPGAGLPKFQTFILRYLLVPRWSKKFSWEKNVQWLEKENGKILQLLRHVPDWETKVLIPPIPGLEDSSRNWSISETLDHMAIVGENILFALEWMKEGKIPPQQASIAAMKPKNEGKADERRKRYLSFSESGPEKLRALSSLEDSKLTYDHPWFGPLTPRQWTWLMATHQGIHKKQLELILSNLAYLIE